MDYKTEILKSIQIMIDQRLKSYKTDRTYESVIKSITPKGYVVSDEAGKERTVQCCIPGIQLNVGQSVWVKEPFGSLKRLHICGIIERR